MATQPDIPREHFGELLRLHRLAAGLTQETLAERAGLSSHGIQKLERGGSRPYRDTVRRLVSALQLEGGDLARLTAAATPVPRRRKLPGSASNTTATARHNLPIPQTRFISRSGELEAVAARLRDNRLVTLWGAGGIGKTRLALEVARTLVGQFADGVWLVDLASVVDPTHVAQAVAEALGLRDMAGRQPEDVLAEYLHKRSAALLILDNCEHLVDACARVVDLALGCCAGVRVLATSREPLNVPGEAMWPVAPLSSVDPGTLNRNGRDMADAVRASEATQLFLDRAQLVLPSFAVTNENAAAVARVTRQLDGIPLAIELAVSRLGVMSVEQLDAGLNQGLRLLSGGYRTAANRHKSLRATLDWSYELLSDVEKVILRRLAVFAGGCTLEAAESVSVDVGPNEPDLLDLLSRLAARSLVLVDRSAKDALSEVRYRLMETVREYAQEKLSESGEAELIRIRHRDWCVYLVEAAVVGMDGTGQQHWWDRLELEHENLRAALNWSTRDPNDAGALLSLVAGLGRFWQTRGYVREGIAWLELALARSDRTLSREQVRALDWLAVCHAWTGHADRARSLLEDCVAGARAIEDWPLLASALRHLGAQVRALGDPTRAQALFEEALKVSRTSGGKREIAWSLMALAESRAGGRALTRSRKLLIESVALGRESGDLSVVIPALRDLSAVYAASGDLSAASRTIAEALLLARRIELSIVIPSLLLTMGDIAAIEQRTPEAMVCYRQGTEEASRYGMLGSVADCLRACARLAAAQADYIRCVRLLAATASVFDAPGSGSRRFAPTREEDVLGDARQVLTEKEYAAAWDEGQSLTLAQAVESAFAGLPLAG
jgi:non-specific serine/threonine protein kinase